MIDSGDKAALTNIELKLVEIALKKNPKSYVAWQHRKWLLVNGEVDLQNELKLCKIFLSLDARNCK